MDGIQRPNTECLGNEDEGRQAGSPAQRGSRGHGPRLNPHWLSLNNKQTTSKGYQISKRRYNQMVLVPSEHSLDTLEGLKSLAYMDG